MHSKYDNMHKNIIVYVLICINNHIIASISFMLSKCISQHCWDVAIRNNLICVEEIYKISL